MNFVRPTHTAARIAIVTELARLVDEAYVHAPPIGREKLYRDLIRSLDFSEEWVKQHAERPLSELYGKLLTGAWKDVEPSLEPET